ncbi:hypothetical protein [Candidatus Borrarchaeum sp.]|nr:hypothetical protein [Candidatus Borrarchaeum sp.]
MVLEKAPKKVEKTNAQAAQDQKTVLELVGECKEIIKKINEILEKPVTA